MVRFKKGKNVKVNWLYVLLGLLVVLVFLILFVLVFL